MNRQSAAGGEQDRLVDSCDSHDEAVARRDEYRKTLEALGVASQHEVYIRKIALPPNARGQRAPCFGIYVRDMED